jgi:hypothetical protein
MKKSAQMKPSPRQAVIVIHGIGRQRPMVTLRGFVNGILDVPAGRETAYYSRPDTVSDSFELRCLRTPGNTRPRTDFYEFYWAHLMPIATWKGMLDWASLLLRRPAADVPRQFRLLWWGLWIGVLLAVLLLLGMGLEWAFPGWLPSGWAQQGNKLPIVLTVLWTVIQGALLSTVGDAATYFSPSPHNVAARHAIRTAGLALLERLHESGEYSRIVVVGHSLGSVIGYDLIRHLWNRYCEKHGKPDEPARDALERAEKLGAAMRSAGTSCSDAQRMSWHEAVSEVFKELQRNEHPWRITDFVTLGSPLAHADLLLAANRRDMQRQIAQHELPVAPPLADASGSFSDAFLYERSDGSKRSTFVPYHAAWTACVCWTNLYFPSQGMLYGDAVGGPIAPLFGPGVVDRAVKTHQLQGWLTHTAYWDRVAADASLSNGALAVLRQTLGLRRHAP